jgi:hypothetical protein
MFYPVRRNQQRLLPYVFIRLKTSICLLFNLGYVGDNFTEKNGKGKI